MPFNVLCIRRMPELPEVETVRRGLERLVVGRKIVSVDVRVPKMIKTDLTAFETDIIGQTFQSIGRRGKYLLLNLDRQVIISHLRMEGKYLLFEDEVSENKHFHTFFKLDNGSTLVYQDVRKFGTMDLLDKEQVADYFCQRKLGPEPTENDFDLATFAKQLKASKKVIKPYLLDQTLVVGLGNIYVDEALWAAKIILNEQVIVCQTQKLVCYVIVLSVFCNLELLREARQFVPTKMLLVKMVACKTFCKCTEKLVSLVLAAPHQLRK